MTIERAFASGATTLDQTSWTLINSMTITTPAAGDYLCVFVMEIVNPASATSGDTLHIRIKVGSTQDAASERQYETDSTYDSTNHMMTTSAMVSPNGSEDITVEYIDTGGAGLVGNSRVLILFPKQGTMTEQNATADDTIATATWTQLNSMVETTPASGSYLLVFTTSAQTPANEEVGFRVAVGGSALPHTTRFLECEASAPARAASLMIACEVNPNGSQNVEIEWSRVAGTGTMTCHERSMVLVSTASGDIFEASDTVDDPDGTSGSDVLIDNMTITDPGVDDYLVLFSSSCHMGAVTANNAISYVIYNAGSAEEDTRNVNEYDASIDNAYMCAFTAGKVTTIAGTDDLQAYWQGGTTATRTLEERTLVAIREETAPPAGQPTQHRTQGIPTGSGSRDRVGRWN